jgi:uncharacterized protein (DUF2235 family)
MSRNIVVCIDGTNNSPGTGMTNVQRLNRMLVRDETQIVYYQPGVGTVEPGLVTRWGRSALQLLDSISAVMLRRHVCSAYRYLMQEHTKGDAIYCFGFSRGAYTVRVLAGMLRKVGLLHRGLDEMVDFAWRTYAESDNYEASREFRNAYSRFIPEIRFLGLFDTVSAVGMPWKPQRFDYTYANDRVQTVRHALALNERRAMFVQNLWQPAASAPANALRKTDELQVWFTGAHSDVGGGYAEDEGGLSRIPLAWMRDHALEAGLRFRPKITPRLLMQNPAAPIGIVDVVNKYKNAQGHDQLVQQKFWHALEWLPLPRWRPNGSNWVRRWRCHQARPRNVPSGALVHFSVGLCAAYKDYRWPPSLVGTTVVAAPPPPGAPAPPAASVPAVSPSPPASPTTPTTPGPDDPDKPE